MTHHEVQGRFQELRRQLDAAYRAPRWDSGLIDRLAQELQPLERALASLGASALLVGSGMAAVGSHPQPTPPQADTTATALRLS